MAIGPTTNPGPNRQDQAWSKNTVFSTYDYLANVLKYPIVFMSECIKILQEKGSPYCSLPQPDVSFNGLNISKFGLFDLKLLKG
ncbi:hypothetical protein SBOR_0781 [Sclerotinia borealis F-4128]|uniref:Uncharacterized protein n=1 Tax=Sclerotinia borealis (strain F-4128) TaxID=1432307 RepID=W9CRY1_SCLBF|nr:hypothetical protein SBOR_0781 [Sclerotinia borealis F-4128]